MSSANDLSRMVPGFEFLQTLMKGASASLPGVQGFGQWVAPTLDPDEIDKRIQELKTVQFWLEQNARLLGTTVQALEVQRMTLTTLQTMNLPLADLNAALQARPSAPAPAPAPAPSAAAARSWAPPAPAAAAPPDGQGNEGGTTAAPAQAKKDAPAAVDPMQWWGALTQQFTEIATKALQDGSADAARHLAAVVPTPAAAAAAGGKVPAEATTRKATRSASAAAKPARAPAPRKRGG